MSVSSITVERCSYPGLDERIVILRAADEVDAVFVRTHKLSILIDTLSTPELCRQALSLVREELDRRPLLVVNSHMDWDHYWGNAAVCDRSPIIAHETAHLRFANPATLAVLAQKQREEARFADVDHVGPTLGFRGHFAIEGGDLTLELLHAPGHTPDHVVVWIPQLRTCLAVDAVEYPIPEAWSDDPADLRQLRASLAMIRRLEPRFLVPAHGQRCDPGTVSENIAYFDALAEKVETAEIDLLEDRSLHERAGFRLEDFLDLPDGMLESTAAFYRKCHRTNLRATVRSRRECGTAT